MPRPPARLKTTETTLRILEAVQEMGGVRVGELVERLDLAKSTVYKHLVTLERNGYLVKEGDTYHVGLKFLNFGEHARSRKRAYEFGEDAVRRLTELTDEEADFVVEEHGRIVTVSHTYHEKNKYVGDISLNNPIAHGRSGTYYYAHNTASGKAILSALPPARLESVLDRWGLPGKTENTITDREALLDELERVRERGYAVDDEEFTRGLRSVGAAVTYPDGRVLGALSVSGPTYRLDGDVLETEIPETLCRVADEFEADVEAAMTGG